VWTWTVGSKTAPGNRPIAVTCNGQTAETIFIVS
jgi:hypothetical protein